jgi:uncharacterized protein (DUF885 family)
LAPEVRDDMLSTMSNIPAPVTPQEVQNFLNLLALIADPALTKARVDQLAKALNAGASEARVQLETLFARENAKLKQAWSDHELKIATAQEEFRLSCARQDRAFAERETAVAELERKAAADAKDAAALKADFERRLSVFKEAAA